MTCAGEYFNAGDANLSLFILFACQNTYKNSGVAKNIFYLLLTLSDIDECPSVLAVFALSAQDVCMCPLHPSGLCLLSPNLM